METEAILALFLAIVTPIIGLLIWQFKQVSKDRQASSEKFNTFLQKQITVTKEHMEIQNNHAERSVTAYENLTGDMSKMAKSQRSLAQKFGKHMKVQEDLAKEAKCKYEK